MPSNLRKRDIKFLVPSSLHKPVFSHPYISGPNDSTAVDTDVQVMSTAECGGTLFCLGALLLELTFNQRIETLRIRKKFMGSDGAPNEFTDLCTAKSGRNVSRIHTEMAYLKQPGVALTSLWGRKNKSGITKNSLKRMLQM